MLWRLVAGLLFKACLPLIAVAGVLTYGSYLRGGDPGALWKSVAGRGADQISSLYSGVREDASRAAATFSRQATDTTDTSSGGGGLIEVYTWVDADGVTHYSSSSPTGIDAVTLSVDPNVNVLAPVHAPESSAPDTASADASSELADEFGGRLPGVAGQVLSGREPQSRPAGDPEPGAAVDPSQLLRMLQSAGH